jgi:hypothetical protein
VASYLDLLAEIDVCFFKEKNIFTDKSVDSVVMVGIHEPLWLYKYISRQFGKKRRRKTRAISNLRPVSYLFLSLNSAEDRMCVMWERKTCLELVTCTVG